ncbi:MAG: hypothetical protein ACK5NK_13305 [Niabella sp.]
MRWLLFLSRVAFLGGIMLILAFSLLLYSWNHEEAISSSIIMAGYVLGFVLIPVVNIIYLLLIISGRRPTRFVPLWILIFNFIYFIILLLYILYINGIFNFKG